MAVELPANQPVRDPSEQPRSVTRAIRSSSVPVVESLQTLHSQAGHPVRRSVVEGRHKPDTAGVVFNAWTDMKGHQARTRGVGNVGPPRPP